MILLALFWSFIQIGLFSIGGGYAAMPLIQHQIVELHRWLSLSEFADVMTVSQMTPGPIAINSATFVGLRIAGWGGALAATFGCVLPSFIIVLFLAVLYYRYRNLTWMQNTLSGLRPTVVALIASAGLSLLVLAFWNGRPASADPSSIDFVSVALAAVSLIILRVKKTDPVWVMLGAGFAGLFLC
ncbi:MAG: chromate transporter [Clostridiaceae bacterium]|nr:chromate transporter [Clostridiaceae bacterium]